MAFIKREHKNNENGFVTDIESVTKPNIISDNEKFNIKSKTYLEDAIDTLNILDKKGIDIYDESRYGGMYLNGKNKSEIKNIEKIFIPDNNIYDEKTQNIDFASIFS